MKAPKLNEIWQIKYSEAIGKEYNKLVRITEDKKELKPPNWRKNKYICEHKGEELIVDGDLFIERFGSISLCDTCKYDKDIYIVNCKQLSKHYNFIENKAYIIKCKGYEKN